MHIFVLSKLNLMTKLTQTTETNNTFTNLSKAVTEQHATRLNEFTNFYFAVYDKEDTYEEDECLESFDTEDEAINFVNEQNAGYGYNKFYYETIEK